MKNLIKYISGIRIAFILSVLWLILLYWIAASFSYQTLLNRFHHLHQMELNEIGDFIAGAFAPLAVIWLIATVFLQRGDLSAARVEFETTHSATYHLALFDKRYQVLEDVRRAVGELSMTGDITLKARQTLARATEMANLLFDQEVGDALFEVREKLARWKLCETKENSYVLLGEKLATKGEKLSAKGEKLLQETRDEMEEIDKWLFEFSRKGLDDLFIPYLKAPHSATARAQHKKAK